jgi:serine phosphatase RsbU (regulator of sigma subunit)
VHIDHSIFEQKIYFIPDSDLVRIYSSDITKQKQIEKNLSRLASFPEQNPSPIIEISLEGNITYTNPACRHTFPAVENEKLPHELFAPFHRNFEKLKSGEISNYSEEIRIGDHYYSQRGRILREYGVVRIFNLDITQQKQTEEIIREKNKDITDSINYAKKIQQSILPDINIMKAALENSFVFYRPKDIISGDFYWFTDLGEYFLFACADCTGHGVPGALMSMIGSNFIYDIVAEREITNPEGALSELDKRIRKALKQNEETESKDGMDIAFCSLHKTKRILHYSGANRPLAIVSKGELKEISPDKFPIGGQFTHDKIFSPNRIELKEGDCIYLFSDGITDQFGGPKGKKFMKKNFFELLLKISPFTMKEQEEMLEKHFEGWKGGIEQTDDVCVIGARV